MNQFFNLIYKQCAMALLLWHFCVSETKAQTDNLDADNFIFNSQVKFSFTAALYDNLELANNGADYFNSRPCFSGELNLSYYQHLFNNIGFNMGIGLGLAPFNINYYFDAPVTSVFRTRPASEKEYLDLIYYEYINSILIIPFSIQKNIEMKNHVFYNLELGTRFNSLVAYPYSIGVSDTYDINDPSGESAKLLAFEVTDNGKKSFLSYFTKVGLFKINGNGNSFHYNLVLHWSPTKIGKGIYEFKNLGFDSYGTVEHNINYIGLEFAYGLTRSKRLK